MNNTIRKYILAMLALAMIAILPGCTGRRDASAKTVGVVMPSKALD